jgi:hypothetical protein
MSQVIGSELIVKGSAELERAVAAALDEDDKVGDTSFIDKLSVDYNKQKPKKKVVEVMGDEGKNTVEGK